jgi:photosystem II stability/assembly factor-like uncharacterized protein
VLDLKQRLKSLDEMPAPDLGEVIRRRARQLTASGAISRPLEERWTSRRRYRLRPADLLAVAAMIAFVIGLAVFAHYARTLGPVKHQPSPPPPGSGGSAQRASMRMIDGTIGWVSMGPSPTVVFRKTGEQQDWIDVTPRDAVSGTELVSAFLDDVTAWVLSIPTSTPTSGSADVWRTLNGGRRWQQIAKLNITPWYSGVRRPDRLVFVDQHNGWLTVKISSAVGLSMVIYRTNDGGVTWTEVSVPSANPGNGTPGAIPVGCTGELTFTSALDGWVPATCPQGDQLFSSRDGGRTWSQQTFMSQVATAMGSVSHFESPVQASSPAGFLYFMWGNGARSNLYVSKDFGASWSALFLPASLEPDRTPPMFVGENGWFAASAGVYRTTDGGHHWGRIDAAMDGWAPARLQFVDGMTGWALARRTGRLGVLRTIDGGRNWFLSWQSP